jgi:hypothetical protein
MPTARERAAMALAPSATEVAIDMGRNVAIARPCRTLPAWTQVGPPIRYRSWAKTAKVTPSLITLT